MNHDPLIFQMQCFCDNKLRIGLQMGRENMGLINRVTRSTASRFTDLPTSNLVATQKINLPDQMACLQDAG